jgi:hypothetical protein
MSFIHHPPCVLRYNLAPQHTQHHCCQASQADEAKSSAHDALTIEHTRDLSEADRRSLTHINGRTGGPENDA